MSPQRPTLEAVPWTKTTGMRVGSIGLDRSELGRRRFREHPGEEGLEFALQISAEAIIT
jgi:hypothetical protein